MINYTGLTDEREEWRQKMIDGRWEEPYMLQEYKAHRHSNLWRATRMVEQLCEYILFLEDSILTSQGDRNG